MKHIIMLSSLLLAAVFVLPVFAVRGDPVLKDIEPLVTAAPADAQAAPDVLSVPPSPGPDEELKQEAPLDGAVTVRVQMGDTAVSMKMDDYLFGVIAAEMPASFPVEALKAQAVAARTYTMYKMKLTPTDAHPDADVCTDFNHCKAYISPDEANAAWGTAAAEYTAKIHAAVTSTDGLAILYENGPILAVFHSASSGRTEAAADVWGSEIPYLQSVESPGEEESPHYYGRNEIDPAEFKRVFLEAYPEAVLDDGNPGEWFTNIKRSGAGGIIELDVGGVTVAGRIIRTMCALRSTNFTVDVEDGIFIFRTTGYGHGVGMSQYGAESMAKEGKTFEEILRWYYVGTEVGPVGNH